MTGPARHSAATPRVWVRDTDKPDDASRPIGGPRGAGWRDQRPATHIEKTARQALLLALNDLGEAVGRNRTIGQITRGSDEANAMLDRLALNVADYMRRHPLPPSSDSGTPDESAASSTDREGGQR